MANDPIKTLLFRTDPETGLTRLFSTTLPAAYFEDLTETPRDAQTEPGNWHSPPNGETHILLIDDGIIVFGVRDADGKVTEFKVGPNEEYQAAAFEDWASNNPFCGHRSQSPEPAKFRKNICKDGFDSISGARTFEQVRIE
jgi:hypothetical protein